MKHTSAIGIVLCAAALAGAFPAAAAPKWSDNSVAYLASGGSREDMAAMRHVARYYPLELEFARGPISPHRLAADIDVMIRDGNGKLVLRAKAEGELMLANVPVGEYAVSATYNGIAIMKNVTVERGGHRKLSFAWTS